MTIYHETTVTKDVNGLPVTFAVTVDVTDDDTDPADTIDFDDAQSAEYLARFTPYSGPGELFLGVIGVTATALGCEGASYLGGCDLPAVRGDGGKQLREEVLEYVKDHDMEAHAIAECVTDIKETANLLAPYATKSVKP